ncbi:MAG: DNA replication/repair protein RecF [Chloroflexaceae bacterium]|nr:DNA replication/repair protein RecF [Chloroflexaceae bacterium]NJO04414.1 DNA replication/repair protein RecF [Chloroflexaceae bacterium]
MYVSNLSLRDFRNYRRLDLELASSTTLLYGVNAAGKTSLLEALYYLATTRSPRSSSDRELVNWQAEGEAGALPFARIAADVQQAHARTRLEVLIQLRADESSTQRPQLRPQGSAQKLIRINRKPVRALDLVGQLRVVLFTPADLVLVYGSPAERRRYLDITLSQLDPHYVRTLAQYNKLLQQRNSLLRAWRERRRPLRGIDDELGYWDNELTAAGGYVLAERLRAVADLNTIAGTLYDTITGSGQQLAIGYDSSFERPTDTIEGAALSQRMLQSLRALRRDEVQRGQTLIGPHRDDLTFAVGGINLGIYGSRGQQRSVALALKLGESRLMYERSGDMPVLLLDDVLSELDMQRRKHVLSSIRHTGQQTLVTATDLSDFEPDFLQQAHHLRVENGQIFAL